MNMVSTSKAESGKLEVLFENPRQAKFVISPNTARPRNWIPRLHQFQARWNESRNAFVARKNREDLRAVMSRVISQHSAPKSLYESQSSHLCIARAGSMCRFCKSKSSGRTSKQKSSSPSVEDVVPIACHEKITPGLPRQRPEKSELLKSPPISRPPSRRAQRRRKSPIPRVKPKNRLFKFDERLRTP